MIFDKKTKPKFNPIGVTRQLDCLGRMTLPEEYRTILKWQIGDYIIQEPYCEGTIVLYCLPNCEKIEKGILRKIDKFGRLTCSSKLRNEILGVSPLGIIEFLLFDDCKIYI